MPTANLLAQSFTTTLYEAEFFSRRLNLVGAAHKLVSRDSIKKALDTYDGAAPGVAQWALRGMLAARNGLLPVTLLGDMGFGTGQTHFAPGERPAAVKTDNALSYELKVLKAELHNLTHYSHDQRVQWLLRRVEQTLQHPCDVGLAGVVVGASSLPALFASSAVGSAICALVGCAAYLVQRAAGDKDTSFVETINKTPAWFNGPAAVLVKNLAPSIPLTFNLMTQIINISFNVSSSIPMHLTLQSARLATLSIKAAICIVGATLGVLVGAAVLATQRLRPLLQKSIDNQSMLAIPSVEFVSG